MVNPSVKYIPSAGEGSRSGLSNYLLRWLLIEVSPSRSILASCISANLLRACWVKMLGPRSVPGAVNA